MAFPGGAATATRTTSEDLEQSASHRQQALFATAHSTWQWNVRTRPYRKESLDELTYTDRRYDEEMQAGRKAKNRRAKASHFELAYRYALRASELRAVVQHEPPINRRPRSI
ncbi:hypothetical protein GCM10022276_28610 [Sphingomonas limnosediminicola]|uniref:Uncharacterized protein n=1 Tax=Sphingomonas limnosediminicola TaxID=940133 RepID=A0ABP7LYR5_9SPHN